MRQSADRVLTTHVGSLPRPADLRALAEDPQRDNAAYEARLKTAVANARSAGLEVVLDCHTYMRRREPGAKEEAIATTERGRLRRCSRWCTCRA